MKAVLAAKQRGFTIVELLVVIVVIAILATISIVAYNGIQDRANNAAIVNDLASLKKKIEMYRIDNDGLYPSGNAAGGPELSLLGFRMTKGAYATSPTTTNNFVYGRNAARDEFCVTALSKSGDIYFISKSDGPTKYGGSRVWDGDDLARMCYVVSTNIGWPIAGYNGADTTTGPYRAWVGGN